MTVIDKVSVVVTPYRKDGRQYAPRLKKPVLAGLVASSTFLIASCVGFVGPGPAQVSVGIDAQPACPYGYFDYAPYSCSPYGYYGPDWFSGGLFIGAGPWFHGPQGFYGHVDNRFDPRHGYAGPVPEGGERAFNHFHANEARDGQGHTGNAGHEGGGEHRAGAQGSRGGGRR